MEGKWGGMARVAVTVTAVAGLAACTFVEDNVQADNPRDPSTVGMETTETAAATTGQPDETANTEPDTVVRDAEEFRGEPRDPEYEAFQVGFADGTSCGIYLKPEGSTDWFGCNTELPGTVFAEVPYHPFFEQADSVTWTEEKGFFFYKNQAGPAMPPVDTLHPGEQVTIDAYTITAEEDGALEFTRSDGATAYIGAEKAETSTWSPVADADGIADAGAVCRVDGTDYLVAREDGTSCDEALAMWDEYQQALDNNTGQMGQGMFHYSGEWVCSAGLDHNLPPEQRMASFACATKDWTQGITLVETASR